MANRQRMVWTHRCVALSSAPWLTARTTASATFRGALCVENERTTLRPSFNVRVRCLCAGIWDGRRGRRRRGAVKHGGDDVPRRSYRRTGCGEGSAHVEQTAGSVDSPRRPEFCAHRPGAECDIHRRRRAVLAKPSEVSKARRGEGRARRAQLDGAVSASGRASAMASGTARCDDDLGKVSGRRRAGVPDLAGQRQRRREALLEGEEERRGGNGEYEVGGGLYLYGAGH
ncbi:hypothetical protein HYPSUDRAFT_425969 [Hypholoma sublateritium FD-334 SS-4]|uniref:Uncharacterized protein n=1 Tax=Hypholoma sublateritium (strain FD-334 SS-4) TaxID=945553 RepID=A0A0D2P377_HYPSF|nr:hypothetical protein HYPSUDRAFT_425969 [Hypholoma sublateritium FD-334 SS-4]